MLLMVGEMTGNLSLLAPAMVAVAIATLVVGDETIYESQVDTRMDSPAHRHRYALPLLSSLAAERAVVPVRLVQADAPLPDPNGAEPALVIEATGRILGELGRAPASGDGTARSAAIPLPAVVRSDTSLDEALDLLARTERRWLPVVDAEGHSPLGIIDARALIRSYREAARARTTRQAALDLPIPTTTVRLSDRSDFAHKRLCETRLPPSSRVLAIYRNGLCIVPNGETVLAPGDLLHVWSLNPAEQQTALAAVGSTIADQAVVPVSQHAPDTDVSHNSPPSADASRAESR
jgi:CIC family chloride channel protein